MEIVDIPPLTALAAFGAVASDDVVIAASGPRVVLTGEAAAETAERMWAWIEDWIDRVCGEIFSHPAKRRRP
jgi:hypothetical protein